MYLIYSVRMELITDVENINNLCIICLSKTKRMIDLGDFLFDDKKYILIKVILEKIMSIKVLSYYPKVICVDCLGSLKTALKLKQLFEKSIEAMKKWFDSHAHDHSELVDNEKVKKEKPIISEKIQQSSVKKVPVKPIPDCAVKKTTRNIEIKAIKKSELCSNSVKVSKKKKRIFCEHCQKYYLSQDRYSKHIKICSVTCKNCSKILPNVEELKEHMLCCENNGTYECDICTQRFETLRKKYAHSRTHNRKNGHKCKLCDGIFKSYGGLQYHKNKVHDNNSYPCEICGKTFSIKSNYTQHLSTHNKGVSKVVCPICGKGFHYGTGLFYHMKVHQNIRNYKCKFCHKKFLNMSGLKRHERTHTGERPYFCSHCPKSFSSSTELKNHEMRHTGDKPNLCIYCQKRFISLYNLKLHMSSHVGSYPCDLCGKSYLNAHVLKLHMKFKHTKDVIRQDVKVEVD